MVRGKGVGEEDMCEEIISGIYKIQSLKEPHKCYVGSATRVKQRWGMHIRELKRNKHGNSRLQNHFNEYGESDLLFIVLEKCEKNDLIKIEQFYIDKLDPFFNICRVAGSTSGKIHSEETKRKIGEKAKKRPVSQETRMKLSIANKGKKRTMETRRKLSESKIGNKSTLGQHHSSEYKRKMSEMRMGSKNPFFGKKHSVETRRKISENNLRRYGLV